jgi:hypothetical protein
LCLKDIKPYVQQLNMTTRGIASNNHLRFSDIEHQHGSMQLKLEDLIKQKNSETVEKYESDFKDL